MERQDHQIPPSRSRARVWSFGLTYPALTLLRVSVTLTESSAKPRRHCLLDFVIAASTFGPCSTVVEDVKKTDSQDPVRQGPVRKDPARKDPGPSAQDTVRSTKYLRRTQDPGPNPLSNLPSSTPQHPRHRLISLRSRLATSEIAQSFSSELPVLVQDMSSLLPEMDL